MTSTCPQPEDVGISIPPHVKKQVFLTGFQHALKGGQLTRVEQLKLSFREGFRAGKLYLRELRRLQGIVEFPLTGRMKIRVAGY